MSYTHISEEAATYDLNQSSLGIVTAKFAIVLLTLYPRYKVNVQ